MAEENQARDLVYDYSPVTRADCQELVARLRQAAEAGHLEWGWVRKAEHYLLIAEQAGFPDPSPEIHKVRDADEMASHYELLGLELASPTVTLTIRSGPHAPASWVVKGCPLPHEQRLEVLREAYDCKTPDAVHAKLWTAKPPPPGLPQRR
jgi:hypothetical protein